MSHLKVVFRIELSRVLALTLVIAALAGWVGHGTAHPAPFGATGAQASASLSAPEHVTPLAKLPDAGRSLGTQTQAGAPADSFGENAAPLAQSYSSAAGIAFTSAPFITGTDAEPPADPLAHARPRAPPPTRVLPK